MSSETRPIPAAQFALAIQDLPMENIYAKAHEIQNSIEHLQKSNAQLQDYSDSIKSDNSLDESVRSDGDRDCLEAINENEIVIKRQQERIALLKEEVERRGARWHEADPTSESATAETTQNGTSHEPAPVQRPRLTDEELRQRLEAQMNDDDDDGMHL